MQTTPVNIRLTPEELAVLDGICGDMFTRQKLAALILKAAIKAVQDNGCQIGLPPKFKVLGFEQTTPATEPRIPTIIKHRQ